MDMALAIAMTMTLAVDGERSIDYLSDSVFIRTEKGGGRREGPGKGHV